MADLYDTTATNGSSRNYNGTTENGASLLETTKTNAAAAYNSVANGPVAQNVQDQTEKASEELSNLAAARRSPGTRAATGQPLTHYHSFFSELLSWRNPRASGIAYFTIVALIFAARYLDVIRYAFKLSWMILGVTVAAEVVGKVVLNYGLATQVRPRRYYTVSRETLDAMIGDVNELVNFFVIEAQRILFAENVYASAAACVAAFLAYYLVKLVPYWGLTVIATTVVFFVPLIYTTNQELIDQQLQSATDVINAQTNQVRDVTQKQIGHVSDITKQYAGDYTAKVQDLLRGRSQSPEAVPKRSAAPVDSAPKYTVREKQPEFPVVPVAPVKSEPVESIEFPDVPAAAPAEYSSLASGNPYATGNPVPPAESVVPEDKPMLAS